MKNLKIGKKLLLTFGSIVVLFCLSILLAVYSLSGNGTKFESFYTSGYQTINEVLEIRRAIQSSAKNIGYSMMSEDEDDTAMYIESAKADSEVMQTGLDYLKQYYQGDQTLVSGFETAMSSVKQAREQVYTLALEMKNQAASSLYFEQVMPGYLLANDYLTKITAQADTTALGDYDTAQKSVSVTTLLLLCVAGVALVITIALATYMTRALVRPIQEIERAAEGMASGDLDVQITYTSRDELGSLSNQMRTMSATLHTIITDVGYLLGEMADGNFAIKSRATEKYVGSFSQLLEALRRINRGLSDTLSQINHAADQVAASSEQVSSGAQALSQGSTEQAASVEELAATITEISEQIRQNSQNCSHASEKVEYVGGEVTDSNQRMQTMLSAMDEISSTSEEISKIIKTIEDIAFQTNILALNAAVEAARAGAAGKGFAVVADEVRNLASKSAEASKNTTQLIERSVHAVENGTRIANETAKSLQNVVAGAGEVTSAIEQISAASEEQAAASAQVTVGVDQISAVVQTNSATAEESAAASEELNGQSQLLKSLVSRFRLREDSNANT